MLSQGNIHAQDRKTKQVLSHREHPRPGQENQASALTREHPRPGQENQASALTQGTSTPRTGKPSKCSHTGNIHAQDRKTKQVLSHREHPRPGQENQTSALTQEHPRPGQENQASALTQGTSTSRTGKPSKCSHTGNIHAQDRKTKQVLSHSEHPHPGQENQASALTQGTSTPRTGKPSKCSHTANIHTQDRKTKQVLSHRSSPTQRTSTLRTGKRPRKETFISPSRQKNARFPKPKHILYHISSKGYRVSNYLGRSLSSHYLHK